MSLQPDTLASLNRLVANDPELQRRLQACGGPAAAADILVNAAHAQGIEVEHADLAGHFRRQAGADGDLSDEELDAVAGGMKDSEFLAMSFFTAGIGCAIYSHGQKGHSTIDCSNSPG